MPTSAIKLAYHAVDMHTWDEESRLHYEESEKQHKDLFSSLEASRQQGREEGMQQGIKEGMQQGIKEGMQQGREEGMQQGIKEEKITIARSMLQEGSNSGFIMKVTGLSKEELEKLASSVDHKEVQENITTPPGKRGKLSARNQ